MTTDPPTSDSAHDPDQHPQMASCPSGDCMLVLEIFTLNNMIMRLGDKLVGHLGLTSSRWLLLGALSHYEEPPTITELSADALLSLQNVSRMVAALEADGLVERFTKPGHGRATFVTFTEEGVKAVNETKRIGMAFAKRFHEGLSDEELAAIQNGMHTLFANLANMSDDPEAIIDAAADVELTEEQEVTIR